MKTCVLSQMAPTVLLAFCLVTTKNAAAVVLNLEEMNCDFSTGLCCWTSKGGTKNISWHLANSTVYDEIPPAPNGDGFLAIVSTSPDEQRDMLFSPNFKVPSQFVRMSLLLYCTTGAALDVFVAFGGPASEVQSIRCSDPSQWNHISLELEDDLEGNEDGIVTVILQGSVQNSSVVAIKDFRLEHSPPTTTISATIAENSTTENVLSTTYSLSESDSTDTLSHENATETHVQESTTEIENTVNVSAESELLSSNSISETVTTDFVTDASPSEPVSETMPKTSTVDYSPTDFISSSDTSGSGNENSTGSDVSKEMTTLIMINSTTEPVSENITESVTEESSIKFVSANDTTVSSSEGYTGSDASGKATTPMTDYSTTEPVSESVITESITEQSSIEFISANDTTVSGSEGYTGSDASGKATTPVTDYSTTVPEVKSSTMGYISENSTSEKFVKLADDNSDRKVFIISLATFFACAFSAFLIGIFLKSMNRRRRQWDIRGNIADPIFIQEGFEVVPLKVIKHV